MSRSPVSPSSPSVTTPAGRLIKSFATTLGAAKDATVNVLKELGNDTEVGLVAYGATECNAPDNRTKGCEDVEVLAGIQKPNMDELECIAKETSGSYSAADNTDTLKQTLSTVVTRAAQAYESKGTELELKDNPDEGLYVGEGRT